MKISYQKLFITFMFISQSISAITLHNKSNTTMRFNIFPLDKKQFNFNFLPKRFGKIPAQSSCNVENLHHHKDYIVNFYDVYNFNNNKTYTISGNTNDVTFEIKSTMS